MYIHELTIKNFRSHRSTKLKLFPITAFVGPGGGGKSNLFDALINLSIVMRGKVAEAFSPYPSGTFAATRSWDARPIEPIGFVALISPKAAGDPAFEYAFDYKQSSFGTPPTFQIIKETILRAGRLIFDCSSLAAWALPAKNYITDDRSLLGAIRYAAFASLPHGAEDDLVEVAKGISHVGKYRLDPILLSRPSDLPVPAGRLSEEPAIWLSYRGDNLASVLYQLQENNQLMLEVVVNSVKEVFPDFDGFGFNFVGEGRVGFSARYGHHPDPVVAPSLSHGMLIFIGLMTLLHMPSRPNILALEEPENGLTPGAIRVFYNKLIQSLGTDPSKVDRQILISSHSPFILYEAWNGTAREYIYQVTQSAGCSRVTPMTEVLATYRAALQSDGTVSIRAADSIMSEGWQSAER